MNSDPRPAQPVKRLVAALYADPDVLGRALAALAGNWGQVDHEGAPQAFDATDYYSSEMGDGLKRTLVSFAPLMDPSKLADAKIEAISVERELSVSRGRTINLDVGYLDAFKVVLASCKAGAAKIYLRDGIYADPVASYAKGRFTPAEWTFPDFRRGLYDRDLLRVRELYKAELRDQAR